MRTLAVLPVKSFQSAKQRLSAALGGGSRQLLAQAMLGDVMASLRRVSSVDAIAVVSSEREVESILRGQAVTVLADEVCDGQSAAAAIGVRHAQAGGFSRVVMVPGDTPLADAAEIDSVLRRSRADKVDVTIVPDRHGTGTNALVLSPPDAIAPSFGPESLGRHVRAAAEAGLSHRVEEVPSLAHDVDSPEDLADLSRLLERCHGVAPRTRGALRQFDRLNAGSRERDAEIRAEHARPSGQSRTVRVTSRRPGSDADRPDQRPAWA